MDVKRDYYDDIQLFESKVILLWSTAFLIFLFTLPLYLPKYYFYLLTCPRYLYHILS